MKKITVLLICLSMFSLVMAQENFKKFNIDVSGGTSKDMSLAKYDLGYNIGIAGIYNFTENAGFFVKYNLQSNDQNVEDMDNQKTSFMFLNGTTQGKTTLVNGYSSNAVLFGLRYTILLNSNFTIDINAGAGLMFLKNPFKAMETKGVKK